MSCIIPAWSSRCLRRRARWWSTRPSPCPLYPARHIGRFYFPLNLPFLYIYIKNQHDQRPFFSRNVPSQNEIFDHFLVKTTYSTCVPSKQNLTAPRNFRFVEKIHSHQSTNMRIPCSIVRAVIHYTDQQFFEIAKLNNLAKLI